MIPKTCGDCVYIQKRPNSKVSYYCSHYKRDQQQGNGVLRTGEPPTVCPLRKAEEQEQQASAFDTQIAGDHYKKLGDYQPWMVCSAWMSGDELRGAAKKDVIAYLARERDKGGIDDIRKAMHTLQIFLELWDKRQGK